MLINNWYVACTSDELRDGEPLGRRMLGCDFVLFRDAQGQIVCASAMCCHRGGALARGKVNDGCIMCPYHGWEFDGTGQCVKIPAMGEDTNIPKRARIDTYPVQEKYGMIWAFLGDLPEAERPQIPDLFPEYDEQDDWTYIPYQFEAKCNWVRMEENSLDTAHTNFVHPSFGGRNPKLEVFPIDATEYGAKVARNRPAPDQKQKTGAIADLLSKEKRTNVTVELEFSLVGVCHRIKPTFRPGMSQVGFTARTPVDPYLTKAFGMQARNYLKEEEHNAEREEGIQKAVREDLSIIEYIKPPMTPPTLSDEFLTETDGMELAFRKKVWEWADKGWEIDWDEFERLSKNHALVIPSPARREDPKNWVHKTVPLRPVKARSAQAAE